MPPPHVYNAYVIKQTAISSCLCPHWDTTRAKNCFIITLGIYDTAKDILLDRRSASTSSGANV